MENRKDEKTETPSIVTIKMDEKHIATPRATVIPPSDFKRTCQSILDTPVLTSETATLVNSLIEENIKLREELRIAYEDREKILRNDANKYISMCAEDRRVADFLWNCEYETTSDKTGRTYIIWTMDKADRDICWKFLSKHFSTYELFALSARRIRLEFSYINRTTFNENVKLITKLRICSEFGYPNY
jgi:hypothetical protein